MKQYSAPVINFIDLRSEEGLSTAVTALCQYYTGECDPWYDGPGPSV